MESNGKPKKHCIFDENEKGKEKDSEKKGEVINKKGEVINKKGEVIVY